MLIKHHKLPPEIKEKLDQLLAIKPKTGLELALSSKKTAMEFPHIFEPQTGPKEFPRMGLPQPGEMEFQHIGLAEPTGVHPAIYPPISEPRIIELSREEEEAMSKVAHENLAEDAEKTIKSFPENLPEDTKVDILVKNIQDKQQELVSQGNLMATDANIVLSSLSDAAIREPESVKNVIIQAASILTGKDPDSVRSFMMSKERTLQAVSVQPSEERLALPLPENVPFEELPPPEEEIEKKARRRDRG
jgi:hypothetical protein